MKLEKRRVSAIMLMLLIFTSSIGIAYAVLQPPHGFWGDVTIGGVPAPDGTLIEAKIAEITYETELTVDGEYGWVPLFYVPADDPTTSEKEGGSNGETVEFYVDGTYAKSYTFEIGEKTSLDLSIPNDPPVADANGPYDGTENLPVTFNGSESYDPDGDTFTYFWEFGDEGTSDEENPNHIYAQEGSYPVTLTVTDYYSFTDFFATTAEIADSEPFAGFTCDVADGPEPLTVEFTDLSTSYDGIVSWLWDFGDEGISTEESPVHEYVQGGIYSVTLTVTEDDGDPDTEIKTDYITITDSEPVADFTADVSEGLEPLTVTFTDGSTAYDMPMTYSWDFGDGSDLVTVQSPIHEYLQEGVYPVTLTVTDADDSTDTETITITVTDSEPVATFEAVPLSGDEPLTVEFTDLSTSYDGIVSWLWDFGDGSDLVTVWSPIHEYLQDGVYTVNLTVTEEDGDFDTATTTITVSDTEPIADFTVDVSKGPEPLTVTFTSTSESYDGITYLWEFGDEETSDEENPTHVYVQDSFYPVTLTVTEEDGDSDKVTTALNVTDTEPMAAFTAVPLSGDEPLTVIFTDMSTSYDGITYLWEFGDGGISTEESPVHEYVDDGVYSVTLTVTEADGDFDMETKTDYIEVYSVIEYYEITLDEDYWNLISLPLIPDDTSIEVILADVLDSVDTVWSYEAGVWYSYKPGAPSDLTEMVDGKGYWMDMSASAVLSVSGTEISKEPPLPSYQLITGWNLIGMPYMPEEPSIEVVFSGILDYIDSIWGYEKGFWYSYKAGAPSDLTEILDGNGYWIKVTTDVLWEIDID